MRYRNPVVRGFHPDPSVCRVGEEFYLATSTFQFFPGIALARSRNLVEWEALGGAISRRSQLDLSWTPPSRGLFAPTLRHGAGRFWLTCTEVDRLGNFILSAPSIEGEWSEPRRIEVGGIDPSLHFDGEGGVWLCSNDVAQGKKGIAISAFDPESGRILEGPRHATAGTGGRWPEGPRLFKRGGAWYLLLSEGGTEYGHMVTIFRAASPWGPWEACPRNPVLSHRDVADNPIQCVGHADIVEDGSGRWWLLALGTRSLGPLLHNLGREVFLSPLLWDVEGWPLVGEEGRLALEMEGPLPGPPPASEPPGEEDGRRHVSLAPSGGIPGPEWRSPRQPWEGRVSVEAGGGLLLRGGREGLSTALGAPTLALRPQGEFDARLAVSIEELEGGEGFEAGLVAYYDEDYHYEAFLARRGGDRFAVLRRRVHDLEVEGSPVELGSETPLVIGLEATREVYRFSLETGDSRIELGSGAVAGLCSEGTRAMSFLGVQLGLFCVGGLARMRLLELSEKAEEAGNVAGESLGTPASSDSGITGEGPAMDSPAPP